MAMGLLVWGDASLARQTLRVGVYENVPLSFVDGNGRVGGVFIDILEHIAENEDWQIEYMPSSWAENLDRLADSRIDLLGVIAYTAERNLLFDYSLESVLTEWGQIYVRKDSGIESILDLKGKKVAVLMGDTHYANLRDLVDQFGIECRFIEAFEYEDVMGIVDGGKCDAGLVSHFFGTENEGRYHLFKSPIVLSPQKLYWATPRGKGKDILNRIDTHLRRIKSDDESVYYATINKWFRVGANTAVGRWFRRAVFGLGGLLAAALAIITVFRSQVRARTAELSEKNKVLSLEMEQRRQAEFERSQLETKLQRSRKMEALGTLAGGVAHDLNNILSGLVSYPELLLMDLPDDSPLKDPILTIKRSGEKAARIVEDLLTLTRRSVPNTQAVDLNQVVRDYLASPEFRKMAAYHPRARVETDLSPRLLNIMGSTVHLSKTVMNLVSNAAEAMPVGGRISIETENRYIDAPIRGYDDIEEGDYVVLTVSDEGIGIPETDIERIFEPFYTKKVMGRSGTGLGMAVVWGTVKDHSGYIDVKSVEDLGTTFTLYFPVTHTELRLQPSGIPLDQLTGAGERILVVDDMRDQRQIATVMLKKLGYTVAVAASGEEGVRAVRKQSFDLVVLDMIMDPGIDGLETLRRILAYRPGIKTVIASGYSDTGRVQEALSLGAGQYVKKPYTLEDIGKAVRLALAS
jgi:signal transduction histidine kinase